MTKKHIRVRVGTPKKNTSHWGGDIYISDTEYFYPDQRIDDIMLRLTELKSRYEETYRELGFEGVNDCGCQHDCSCPPTYYLTGLRLETDLEYDYRIAQEKEAEKRQHARDLAELKRLQKKLKIKE